jgi:hypothetical protein
MTSFYQIFGFFGENIKYTLTNQYTSESLGMTRWSAAKNTQSEEVERAKETLETAKY